MGNTSYFPASRLIDFNKYEFYFTYGNTPPEDLLQSVTAEVSKPEVLLLGCGDMRSCLYTLWNNFDPKHSRHFTGVHFVLNDISTAVLARDIIFLYLCTKMPSNEDDIMKWVASFWSIWFCHELLPQHKQVLMDALSQLLQWSKSSKSWSEMTSNPLRKLVHFVTPSTLTEIHKMWHIWYSDDRPVEVIRTGRMEWLKETESENYHRRTEIHLVRCFGTFKYQNLSSEGIKCIEDELQSHHQYGTAFAEDVFGLPVEEARMINSTFFEKADGTFNSHNGYPFRCFSHPFKFSPEYVRKFSYSVLVNEDSFSHHPLLANSVQQFSIWVTSCAAIFSNPHCISFSFQRSDSLDFCQSLYDKVFTSIPHSFDVIYTSNLIDFIALPSLVLLAMRVLKQTGLLFTSAFRYVMGSDPSRGYLPSLFGFDSKYLPLLCGIRCIGFDSEYSAELSVKPVSMVAEVDVMHCVIEKPLVWQHVVASPLKQCTPSDINAMLNALCNAVKQMLTCFLKGASTTIIESLLCTETVILLLQSCVSQLDGTEYDYNNYKLWSPLCSMLLNEKCLKPFVMSLQIQSLLHGLHLHLIVSKLNCPLCSKKSLRGFIKQCSITVKDHSFFNEPRVSILIHKLGPDTAKVMKVWSNIQSRCVDNVHVVSSIAKRQNIDGKISYECFVPTGLIKKDYQLTIVAFNLENKVRMAHSKFSNCKIKNISYSFHRYVKCHSIAGDLAFGTVLQHSGNISCFESVISLSEQSMRALEHHQLTTSLLNISKVKFAVDNLSTEISYPYPIDYNKMSIKLSRQNKRITVLAYRRSHQLYEEQQPVYIVNPDNALVLPTMPIHEFQDLPFYSGAQYSFKDRGSTPSPEINAKKVMATILQGCDKNFFQLVYSGEPTTLERLCTKCQCLVVVEDRKFDLLNKTPAVDLWFCSLTPEMCEEIYLQWCAVYATESGDDSTQHVTTVDEKESQLLQGLFKYFATRTVSTSKKLPGKRYQLLVKHKIDRYFTRAVVYPLYPSHTMMGFGKVGLPECFDQLIDSVWHSLCAVVREDVPLSVPVDELADTVFRTLYSTKKPDQNKCSYCGNHSEDLRKCSRCHSVQYCNKECQKKHWGTHKTGCHPQGHIW